MEAAVSERNRIARNTVAYAAAQLAQMASAFVFMPFLVAQFGLADYGIYLLAVSVSGYLGLLDLGVGATVIKMVAQLRAQGDDRELSALVSSTLVFYLGIGVLAASALVGFGVVGVRVFELTAAGEELASRLFIVAGLLALIWWPANLGGLLLSGLQEYRALSRIAVAATLINVFGTIGVLVWDLSPVVLLAVNSVTGIGAGVAYWLFARRFLPGMVVSLARARISTLRSVFSLSWAMFVFQVCNVIVYQQTDRIVLGVFAGPAPVALYEGPAKMHSAVAQVAGMTATAVLPAASQFEAEGRLETLQALFLRGTKLMVAFVGSISVTLVVLAGPILLAWLGSEYETQALGAQVFVAGWLVTANMQVGLIMVMGLGRIGSLLPYLVGQAVANVALSLALVGPLGVLGVILGTVLTSVVATPLMLRFVMRSIELDPSRWFARVARPVYPLLLIPVVVGGTARALGLAQGLAGTIAAAMVAVSCCWAALYLLGFDEDERADVRAFAGAVGSYLGLDRLNSKGSG